MNKRIILHLSLIPGVGPGAIERILSGCLDNDLVNLYKMSAQAVGQRFKLSERMATIIAQGLQDQQLLQEELKLLEKHQVAWVTVGDETYPELLKHIHLPPAVLYYRGSMPKNDKSIACVGSRQADRYGQMAINRLIPGLVEQGWHVVSGGALGIDTMAHQAVVRAGGRTTAVIGSGLLRLYPATNKKLFDEIIALGGAVISPFPLLTAAAPGNFPARNRIIAGMSSCCLVVQAAARSGASITASCALNEGRTVYAVPGPIDNPLSVGCHRLLAQGATLVSDIQDIEPILGEKVSFKAVQPGAASGQETGYDRLVRACREPRVFDDLMQEFDMSIESLNEYLFMLQLEGRLIQNSVGMWQAA